MNKKLKPAVLWFTGLSGSGKSTISEKVYAELKDRGYRVEHLDGDAIRDVFPKTGFSRDERNAHVRRVGYIASRLQAHEVFVVGSFISPYKEARDFVREMCEDFVEIHISTPLEECERRDVKGLYKKARKGEITQFTGIDDPYEAPQNPELEIDTTNITIDEAVQRVLEYLEARAS
ncbi:MAG TPA: adenylyl-sulfate kinase [Balneolaceae bacterium]